MYIKIVHQAFLNLIYFDLIQIIIFFSLINIKICKLLCN